jgi:N-methylhydantoinase A/oxoprolinase/acetone carboxylase beta subunit
LLIGQHPAEQEFPTQDLIVVPGGHGPSDEEKVPLDTEAIREFGDRTKDKVSAYEISFFVGTRNPEHELRAKSLIQKVTGKPVVCGH